MPYPVTSARKTGAYPSREKLDQASMRIRRAFARLHKEGQRSPDVADKLEPLVLEAARVLNELAGAAEKAENSSSRNVALVAKARRKAEDTARLVVRAAERRGVEPNPRAVAVLEKAAKRAAQNGEER